MNEKKEEKSRKKGENKDVAPQRKKFNKKYFVKKRKSAPASIQGATSKNVKKAEEIKKEG